MQYPSMAVGQSEVHVRLGKIEKELAWRTCLEHSTETNFVNRSFAHQY